MNNQPNNTKYIIVSILAILGIFILIGIAAAASLRGSNASENNDSQDSAMVSEMEDTTEVDEENEENAQEETDHTDSIADSDTQQNTPDPELPATGSPARSELDPTVELVFANAFAKSSVNDTLDCGSGTVYTIKRTVYQGKSSTLSVIQNEDRSLYDSAHVAAFEQILDTGSLDAGLHTTATSTLINRACSGFGVTPLYELDMQGYEYGNVDAARAFVALQGQGVAASPSVMVYAEKGGSLIKINYQLRTGDESRDYDLNAFNTCQSQTSGAPSEAFNNCMFDIAKSVDNNQRAYVALNKIVEDYRLVGPEERTVSPAATQDGLQTLTLSLENYFDSIDDGNAVFFRDSSGNIYIIRNNSDMLASAMSIFQSVDGDRATNASFVITATYTKTNEVFPYPMRDNSIDYTITGLQRYTFTY